MLTINDITDAALDFFQEWLISRRNVKDHEVDEFISKLADDLTPGLKNQIVNVANSHPPLFHCDDDSYPYC